MEESNQTLNTNASGPHTDPHNIIDNTPDQTIEKVQIMTFVDDSTPQQIEAEENQTVAQSTVKDISQISLTDIIERVIDMESVVLATTLKINEDIVTYSIPQDIIKANTQIQDKLKGFRYFYFKRCRISIMPQVSKVQQGRLMCKILPLPVEDASYNSALDTLTQFSCLEGDDIDLSQQKRVEIVVPWSYPVPAFTLTASNKTKLPIANLILRLYARIAPRACALSITAQFEGVRLTMPTSEALDPSLTPARQNKVMYGENQMGKFQKQEQKSGTISGLLSAGANLASAAAKIPLISSVASTASTILSIGSNVAAFFGYSKPQNDKLPDQIKPMVNRFMNNSMGSENSHQMALNPTNEVAVEPGFANAKLVETSINSIIRTPCYIDDQELTNATPSRTLIASYLLQPRILGTTSKGSGSSLTFHMTPLAYLLCCFQLWCGGLVLRFKFTKTQFHSVRLIFIYRPDDSAAPATLPDNYYMNYHQIVDLVMVNEHKITIPYLQNEYWKYGYAGLGRLDVYTLNQLQVGAGASNFIGINVELSAANDFKMAIPRTPHYDGKGSGSAGVKVKPITNLFKPGIESAMTFPAYPGSGPLHFTCLGYSKNNVIAFTSPDLIGPVAVAIDFGPLNDNTKLVLPNTATGATGNFELPTVPGGTFYIFTSLNQNPGNVTILVSNNKNPAPTDEQYKFLLQDGVAKSVGVITSAPISQVYGSAQVGRLESILESDPPSIINNFSQTNEDEVLSHTTGESVDSVMNLMSRNIIDKEFTLLEGAVEYELVSPVQGNPSNYMNFLSPMYRAYYGGLTYLVAPPAVDSRVEITYKPGMKNIDSVIDEGSASNVLHLPGVEGSCTVRVPYYNRQNYVILGQGYKSYDDTTLTSLLNVLTVASDTGGHFKFYKTKSEDTTFIMFLAPPTCVVAS